MKIRELQKLQNWQWVSWKMSSNNARQLLKNSLRKSLPHIFGLPSADTRMRCQLPPRDQYAVRAAGFLQDISIKSIIRMISSKHTKPAWIDVAIMEILGISVAYAMQPLDAAAFPNFRLKTLSTLQCASIIHPRWKILRPSRNALLRNVTLLARSSNCDLAVMPLQQTTMHCEAT